MGARPETFERDPGAASRTERPAHVSGTDWTRRRLTGLALALLSGLTVCAYVFWLCPYDQYLFSDMKNFWTQAMLRLDGKEFADSQFVAWPPLYHIFLAELFRILRSVGLGHLIRLETALLINIAVFTLSVYCFQRLAARWFAQRASVLLCVLLYAFGFPALYFNAFLLSDNLGAPLLVMAVSAMVCLPAWRGVLVAAVLFAAAVIIRPAMGPYGLAFVGFLLAREGRKRRFLLQAALFSGVFFALISLASLEVARISQGRVHGLSANGGLDFFIANTDYHRVDLAYNGWHFFVIVPAQSWKPENGVFYTNVPFYEQGYYFQLGWEALKRDPMRMVRNLSEIRNLFFADMLPTRTDAPGFSTMRPVWDWLKFAMFLSLGLYLWRWRELGERRPAFVLLSSIIGITLLVSVLFTGEPRYTYAICFTFYLLSIHLLESMRMAWRRWLRPAMAYALGLAAAAGVTWGGVQAVTPRYPDRILLDFEPHRDMSDAQHMQVSHLVFPHSRQQEDLRHADNPQAALFEPGLLRLRTQMEVLGDQPLELTLRTYCTWPLALVVDHEPRVLESEPNFFRDVEETLTLQPGMHEVELQVNYLHSAGGIALNYVYESDGWQVRRAVGLDSERVRFHLPPRQDGAQP